MAHTVPQFSDFTSLEVALRTIWNRELQLNSPLLAMFNQQNSSDTTEVSMEFETMGGETPEYNGSIEYNSIVPGDKKTYTHTEYADGIAIKRKLMDDAKYGLINRMMSEFSQKFDRTIRRHAAGVFNNAFVATTDAQKSSDGYALCDGSSRTANLQNSGTDALSESTIIATRQAMMRFKDENDVELSVMPDTLIVPIELESAARVAVESALKPGTANNDVNVNDGGYRIIVDPYLTDANNWFMVDSRIARNYLLWFWRVRPEFMAHPAGTYDLEYRYRGYMRYSFGFDSAHWIYGHNVA